MYRYNAVQIIFFSKNLAACSLAADAGTGSEAEVTVYMHYDAEKDNCYPFRYSGSGGNANRFITERQCMRNCSHRADELFPRDGNNIIYIWNVYYYGLIHSFVNSILSKQRSRNNACLKIMLPPCGRHNFWYIIFFHCF